MKDSNYKFLIKLTNGIKYQTSLKTYYKQLSNQI